ncbi:hypothetical protein MJ1_0259 [Nanobdella aerobiophila]|uniref:Uncharacterized protein n=1 Tax=Nanobdella aerobiophila TaxID=2586965 RepID=A0A915WSL3_9ARCH|nr:DUF973 family protein [Nanobdella aerobiophila]BBL45430.1 hypothetical protein MJ1_0259 [Nanobdella aerobiophila]
MQIGSPSVPIYYPNNRYYPRPNQRNVFMGKNYIKTGLKYLFVALLIFILFIILLFVLKIFTLLLIFSIIIILVGGFGLDYLWKGFAEYEKVTNKGVFGLAKFGALLYIIPFTSFIGSILVGIGFYNIGVLENNDKIKIGGILSAIPFVGIIGLLILLIYFH